MYICKYRDIRSKLTSTVFSKYFLTCGFERRDSSGFSPSDNLPASITRREFNERTECGGMWERTRVERSASETKGLEDRSGRNDGDVFARRICTRSVYPNVRMQKRTAVRQEEGNGEGMFCSIEPMHRRLRLYASSGCTCMCICAVAMRLRMLVVMFCWWCARFCRIFIEIPESVTNTQRSHCFYIFRPYFIFKCPWRIFCRSRSYVLNASAIRARTTSSFFFSGHIRVI